MKPFLLLLFATLIYNNTLVQAQVAPMPDSVNAFLNKSLDIIHANAINRDSVNWLALKEQVFTKASGAKTYEDLLPIYPYIFQQIGDHHGALNYKSKPYYWPMPSNYSNQLVKQAVKKYNTVIVKKLTKHIGYILIPGNNDFGAKRINEDAQVIRNAIASLNHKHIKGWIIDLRVNTGGNMYQMLAGLGLLLGDGPLGGFVNQHNQSQGEWFIKNGNIFIDTTQVSNIPDDQSPSAKQIPIAVLISGQTASSGEVVAISTVGRKNTVLIGENSAGFTTGNKGFKINEYAGLNLAVDFDKDRTGKVYKSYVAPTILINGGDNFENLSEDLKVISAIKWLQKVK
jgi:carboxyl-terminal processing protease